MKQKKIDTLPAIPSSLIGEEYLMQVSELSELSYSPDRIATLLGLSGTKKIALIYRISCKNDTYNLAYNKGFAESEKVIDDKLLETAKTGDVDAIKLLGERKQNRIELDLRMKLFGI